MFFVSSETMQYNTNSSFKTIYMCLVSLNGQTGPQHIPEDISIETKIEWVAKLVCGGFQMF